MKKTTALILIIALCVTLGACKTKDKTPSAEDQIKLISDNITLWQGEDPTWGYGYAVTDLDGNGRLEIIASLCQGTGLFTNSSVWEVNETFDGLSLCEQTLSEGDSEADIMVETAPVYYDEKSGIYYFIFEDYLRNGYAEHYENKRALSLQSGKLEQIFLAYKTTLYDGTTETVTYTDTEGNQISEEEYDSAADSKFTGLKKMSATIGWITGEDGAFSGGSEQTLKLLTDSYNAFGVK